MVAQPPPVRVKLMSTVATPLLILATQGGYMRFLLAALCLTGLLLVTDAAAAQSVPRAHARTSTNLPYACTALLRAGISFGHTDTTLPLLTQTERTHRVKHAAIGAGIGAGLGLITGAVIGARIDRTRPGTISAIPIVGIQGAGIGLIVGLIVGALTP